MSIREESGRNDTVIITAQPLQKPKEFIETLADIQQVAAIEQRGASIHEIFFTLKNKLDFFIVGLKRVLKGVEIMSGITCKSGASAIYDFASNLLKIYIYV
jgi:hypothetical protein